MAVRFSDFRERANARTKQDLSRAMMRIGFLIERRAKESMTGGGLPHTPSQPGDPPHVDTGRLRSSITTVKEETKDSIIIQVGTNVEYGLYLELGTRHIQPRPWLRPAFMAVISKI